MSNVPCRGHCHTAVRSRTGTGPSIGISAGYTAVHPVSMPDCACLYHTEGSSHSLLCFSPRAGHSGCRRRCRRRCRRECAPKWWARRVLCPVARALRMTQHMHPVRCACSWHTRASCARDQRTRVSTRRYHLYRGERAHTLMIRDVWRGLVQEEESICHVLHAQADSHWVRLTPTSWASRLAISGALFPTCTCEPTGTPTLTFHMTSAAPSSQTASL